MRIKKKTFVFYLDLEDRGAWEEDVCGFDDSLSEFSNSPDIITTVNNTKNPTKQDKNINCKPNDKFSSASTIHSYSIENPLSVGCVGSIFPSLGPSKYKQHLIKKNALNQKYISRLHINE